MLRLTNAYDGSEHVFSRRRLPVTVGRAPHVDLRVDDRFASRVHCEVEIVGDSFVVHDLSSRHGTFLNGVAIVEESLQSEDVLQIGMTAFKITLTIDSTGG